MAWPELQAGNVMNLQKWGLGPGLGRERQGLRPQRGACSFPEPVPACFTHESEAGVGPAGWVLRLGVTSLGGGGGGGHPALPHGTAQTSKTQGPLGEEAEEEMLTETFVLFQPVAISTVFQEKPPRLPMSERATGWSWSMSYPEASVGHLVAEAIFLL